MKKMNCKKYLAVAASAVLTLSMMTACGTTTNASQSADKAVGTVLLSVNPEIEVEYDEGGMVLEIEGLNDGGKKVVTDIDVEDYLGKDCRTAVNALVEKIYEDGYFEGTLDGHAKNIVLKLEKGSVYVSDEFLEDMADGVRETVRECGADAKTMTVSEGDLDDDGRIGQKKAKELVLSQMGLNTASFLDHEYELDDGVYEFEFTADGVEYEYEVDARTGKVLKADMDGNDDWDDRDDWDDWNTFKNNEDDDDDDDQDDRDDDDNDDDHDDDQNDRNDDDHDDDDKRVDSVPVKQNADDDDDKRVVSAPAKQNADDDDDRDDNQDDDDRDDNDDNDDHDDDDNDDHDDDDDDNDDHDDDDDDK